MKLTNRTYMQFYIAIAGIGPYIGYDCYRSLWNKLEKKVLEISN
jgi:hypothetical protein